MKQLCILSLMTAVQFADAAKILIYDYKFQRSHVQFINTVADILVDEGHDVVMLSNVLDANLQDIGSKRVRRYFTKQTPEAHAIGFSRIGQNNWKATSFYDMIANFGVRRYVNGMTSQCLAMLQDHRLIEQLRAEKFFVALMAPNDFCIYYLFHKARISNYAFVDSHSTILNPMWYTGVPDQYSTLPGITICQALSPLDNLKACSCRFLLPIPWEVITFTRFASFSEMTFRNRLKNFLNDALMKIVLNVALYDFTKKIEEKFDDPPNLYEQIANTSMVFMNRIPAIEFPSLTTHTTVDIGGLTITKTNKSLDEHWSSILSLRPRTVLISFGTIALSSDMPEGYKKSIFQTIQSFPDVTFKPEDRISEGINNLIEAKFTPQREILQDSRLALFITHCGLSSTLETMMAGVPVIAIPTSTDQHRNAQVLKNGGGGIIMDKRDLESSEAIERNIRSMLKNERFANSARRTASVIANSPYSGKENFLRNLNFLIKFGPLHNMRIPSHNQSFIEYHMIDVYALVTVVFAVITCLIFIISRHIIRIMLSIAFRKVKNE